MATANLRERNKAKRRDAIVAAAIDLFASQGYHQTTIGEIAERAELASRTVSVHFPAKLDIVKADIEDLANELIETLGTLPPGSMALDACLDWIQRALLDTTNPHVRNRMRMYASNEELVALLSVRISEVVEQAILADPQLDRLLVDPVDRAITGASIAGVARHLATLGTQDEIDAMLERSRLYFRGGFEALRSHPAPASKAG
jgi:AcrR family transcriptional regulator